MVVDKSNRILAVLRQHMHSRVIDFDGIIDVNNNNDACNTNTHVSGLDTGQ